MIRFLLGKGVLSPNVNGSANAAAIDTTPRIPAQLNTRKLPGSSPVLSHFTP